MTARKPAGVSWQSWIDRQIEHGRARGDFDDLPGHGKPIDGLERPRDELWWVRDKLRREGVEFLPPSLAIRKKADEARRRALEAPSARDARRILEDINEEIRQLNRHSTGGPPTTLMPFDVGAVLEDREPRTPAEVEGDEPPAQDPTAVASRQRRGSVRRARLRAWMRRDHIAPHDRPAP
jgi:hypothetical protein